MVKLKFNIFVHDLEVPPMVGAGSNIKLGILNQTGSMEIIPLKNESTETTLTVVISDQLSFGFTGLDESTIKNQLDIFLSSVNLSLSRACANIKGTNLGEFMIDLELKTPEGKVWKNGNKVNVTLNEVIAISGSPSFVKIISDTIDEVEVTNMFQNINNLNKLKLASTVTKEQLNLLLALDHYQNAAKASNLLFIFRDLFNSLQQIVDIHGKDISGTEFDKECGRLTNIDITYIENMRHFFDRIKHVQRNNQDIQKVLGGNDIYKKAIPVLRRHTRELLRSQLL
jgi:hypothetical protein